jgi:hypothetical protein
MRYMLMADERYCAVGGYAASNCGAQFHTCTISAINCHIECSRAQPRPHYIIARARPGGGGRTSYILRQGVSNIGG